MATLQQLSFARVQKSGNLPVFTGVTASDRLSNGSAAARTALLKFVPNLKFDVEASRDIMSQVDGWIARNQAELAAAMQSSDKTLPKQLCMSMGSAAQVQQWIIANYTVAAAGLGPWYSGRVESLSQKPGSGVSAAWAADDAAMRLSIFAMIVKLDLDGELDAIFNPKGGSADPCAASGFGLAVITQIIIAVAIVAFAAIVVHLALDSKRVQRNNDLMDKLCLDAKKSGDEKTVLACVEALRDIQVKGPFGNLAGELGKAAVVVGGGYLVFKYGLPWATKQLRGS